MISAEYMDYLKVLHGSFNTIVGFLFLYQGLLGLRIRKERKSGGQRDVMVIKRHRREGPIFAALGVTGYLAGVVLVYLDTGHLVEYPSHLITGSGIALLITTTYIISKRIKGSESPWRTPHFVIGLCILFLYILQIYIGLDILL